MNDFSKKTLKVLSSKGLRLVGLQGDGYIFNQNGKCRVLSFSDVMEAAR